MGPISAQIDEAKRDVSKTVTTDPYVDYELGPKDLLDRLLNAKVSTASSKSPVLDPALQILKDTQHPLYGGLPPSSTSDPPKKYIWYNGDMVRNPASIPSPIQMTYAAQFPHK